MKSFQEKWEEFIFEKKIFFDEFFFKNSLKRCFVWGEKENKIIVSVPSDYVARILKEKQMDLLFEKQNSQKIIFITSQNKPKNETKTKNEQKYSFDNLIVGSFNEKIIKISKKIINKENNWGTLFFYSETGLGKTHIMKAIAIEAAKKNISCLYINSFDFGSRVLDLFWNKDKGKKNRIEEEKKNILKNDILLFDDIQFLSERTRTNQFLFQIICQAKEENKQVVFSCDRHPQELIGFEKKIKSRFSEGLLVKISFPDEDTMIEIVKNKILKYTRKIDKITPKTINFIAQKFGNDIRKTEGAIKTMLFNFSDHPEREITLLDFKKVFVDQNFVFENKISIKKIKKIVAKFYKVNYNSMINGERKKEIVKARRVAMYLVRKLTLEKFSNIALQFKISSHATVINAVKEVKKQILFSLNFKKEVDYLKKICQEET